MEKIRKPFQGVGNIIRFNWHFYFCVALLCTVLIYTKKLIPENLNLIFNLATISAVAITFLTLLVSFYVYDFSGLYKLNWLPNSKENISIANINAGFDETSELLKLKYPKSDLTVLDFYDPLKHTEISIKRARKAYPAYPNTKTTTTANLPLQTNSLDKIFLIFSAHEIRNENERVAFFIELTRVLKNEGEIYVTEHLRDLPNFLAYNIGFMHFLAHDTWIKAFSQSKLTIKSKEKLNPFITNFTLIKNGNTG
jgi:SAM-dependent methyltransferase